MDGSGGAGGTRCQAAGIYLVTEGLKDSVRQNKRIGGYNKEGSCGECGNKQGRRS